MHLVAYNGRDDKLFRAGILESGAPVYYGALNTTEALQPNFDLLVQKVNCTDASDPLQCLREVPTAELNTAINSTTSLAYGGSITIDGDIVAGKTSEQVKDGRFVHVPVIAGTTADEGTAFGPVGVTNTSVFYQDVAATTNSEFARKILKAYPDVPALGIPSVDELPPDFRPGLPFGAQYRRSCAYFGDAYMLAGRRLTCESWAAEGVPAYCFRFNAKAAGVPQEIGVTHFTEVAFVFNNLNGVGYPPAAINPFTGKGPEYTDLSNLVTSDWASFISALDPNAWRQGKTVKGNPEPWPVYELSNPKDFVYDANVSSFAEPDTYRKAGMKLINDNALTVYQR
jgi:carboxylesterase type B